MLKKIQRNPLVFCLLPFFIFSLTVNGYSQFNAARLREKPEFLPILKPAPIINRRAKSEGFFFQQSLGAAFIGIGYGPGINYEGLEEIGFGIYYSPKLAFALNDANSVCFGTNIQGIANEDVINVMFPVTIGYNLGAGATEDNEILLGLFVNVGFARNFLLTEDETIAGPYLDAGLRFGKIELRFSVLKEMKQPESGFVLGLGIGGAF